MVKTEITEEALIFERSFLSLGELKRKREKRERRRKREGREEERRREKKREGRGEREGKRKGRENEGRERGDERESGAQRCPHYPRTNGPLSQEPMTTGAGRGLEGRCRGGHNCLLL